MHPEEITLCCDSMFLTDDSHVIKRANSDALCGWNKLEIHSALHEAYINVIYKAFFF